MRAGHHTPRTSCDGPGPRSFDNPKPTVEPGADRDGAPAAGAVRGAVRRYFARTLRARARALPRAELYRPAMVFAPHPDDETLGCGGTVALLRQAGVPVQIVVLTDGGTCHERLMAPGEMARRRASESLAAAKTLGIDERSLHLFGLADLRARRTVAEARCLDVLRRHRPELVLLPHRADVHAEHCLANAIVRRALARLERPPRILEYPVWLWHSWPWTPAWPRAPRRLAQYGLRSPRCAYHLLRDLRTVVDVAAVLPRKRAALACHRTQMSRIVPDPAWLTLEDVAGGEWLARFFTGEEFFHCIRTS